MVLPLLIHKQMLTRWKTENRPIHPSVQTSHSSRKNRLGLIWRLLLRVGAPPAARGGTAEEGEDPWTEVGGRQAQGPACGAGGESEKRGGEVVHREGIEEGTSFLEVGGPTLETEE